MSEDEDVGNASFGAASLARLRQITTRVAVRYGYPPPDGHQHWTRHAADEWVFDVLLDKKGPEIVVTMQVMAKSADSLTAQLTVMVHNVFRSESRATLKGKIIARMATLLGADGQFLDSSRLTGGVSSWTLTELGDEAFDGDWRELLSSPALRGLPVLGELKQQGPTSAADAATLKAASRVLLVEAGGAIRAADLAQALITLFELDDPQFGELGDEPVEGRSMTMTSLAAPGSTLEAAEIAEDIFGGLDAVDIRLLPYLDRSPAAVRKLSPTVPAPARRMRELRATLRRALEDVDARDLVMGELLRLSDRDRDEHDED